MPTHISQQSVWQTRVCVCVRTVVNRESWSEGERYFRGGVVGGAGVCGRRFRFCFFSFSACVNILKLVRARVFIRLLMCIS